MKRICIIGAGPAGLWSAIEGAKKGFEIDVFEQKGLGENISCAEGFFDALKVLGEPEAGVRFKVKEILIQGKVLYRLDASNVNLWMIDRKQWQKFLGEKAKNLGVKIFEHTRIAVSHLKDLKKKYDWVIDASGVSSVTSRFYGFVEFYKENSGKTVQYTMKGDFSHLGNRIKVGFERHYIGYYWIFPKGKDEKGVETANVGFGLFKKDPDINMWDELDRIVEKEGLKTREIVKKRGGLCPTRMVGNPVYDNIILVGDACGLTSPLHGGGMDLACISAATAIESIAAERVDLYKKNLLKIISAKLDMERALYNLWVNKGYDYINALINKVASNKYLADLVMSPGTFTKPLILLKQIIKRL